MGSNSSSPGAKLRFKKHSKTKSGPDSSENEGKITLAAEPNSKPKPKPATKPKIQPRPLGLNEHVNIATVHLVLSFLDPDPHLLLVCKRFQVYIAKRRQAELDGNYAKIKALGQRIYEQFLFMEKWTIHRSSPLVMNLRVFDNEEIQGMDRKALPEETVLEEGRIISLRRQTQLSNFAETWRQVGLSSEKAETFDLTFEHMWNSLNLKRWINRDDILWLDENSDDHTKLVNDLFKTLQDIKSNLQIFKNHMNSIMWHILAEEHKKAVAIEEAHRQAERRRERDQARKTKAGAFIVEYKS